MRITLVFQILIVSLLFTACADQPAAPSITAVDLKATSTAVPTVISSPTAEAPAPVPPPEEELVLLRANPWEWVSFTNPVQQFSIADPQNYALTFNSDGTIIIKSDCNNANGSYITDGGSLTIQVGPMTMAACPPGSRSDEFTKNLGFTAIYFFKDGHLFIDLFADGGTLEFAPPGEVSTGNVVSAANSPQALVELLGNLSYSGVFPDHPITLTDGIYNYTEGDSSKPYVRLIERLTVTGDLNEDGTEDAVILLEDNPGGSARFTWLAAVLNVWNDPQPVDALIIEDRIAVKSLVMDGSQVVAEIIGHGPGDVDCCPTWNVRKVFNLENDRLVEGSSEQLSKVSLDVLNGTTWRLADLNGDQEPVLPETEITLSFADGQISGFSGCNNYNSAVTGEQEFPNSISIGQIAATQMMCSEPISNQESTYLTRLGEAVRWWYDFGYLVLAYPLEGDVLGELVFEPKTP